MFSSFKGGNGYDLSKHLLTPFAKPANDSETRFNKAHSKILRIAQMTIEDLQRRFECLLQLGYVPEGSLDKKCNIIKSCCVLHNIAKKFSVPRPAHNDKVPVCNFPGRVRLTQVEVNPEALKARQEVVNSHFSKELHCVEETPVSNKKEEEDKREKEQKGLHHVMELPVGDTKEEEEKRENDQEESHCVKEPPVGDTGEEEEEEKREKEQEES